MIQIMLSSATRFVVHIIPNYLCRQFSEIFILSTPHICEYFVIFQWNIEIHCAIGNDSKNNSEKLLRISFSSTMHDTSSGSIFVSDSWSVIQIIRICNWLTLSSSIHNFRLRKWKSCFQNVLLISYVFTANRLCNNITSIDNNIAGLRTRRRSCLGNERG